MDSASKITNTEKKSKAMEALELGAGAIFTTASEVSGKTVQNALTILATVLPNSIPNPEISSPSGIVYIPIDSSNIKGVAFQLQTGAGVDFILQNTPVIASVVNRVFGTLYVMFHNYPSEYAYSDFSYADFIKLLNGQPSVGKYFYANIRSNSKYNRIK